jgi:hypothetical protein
MLVHSTMVSQVRRKRRRVKGQEERKARRRARVPEGQWAQPRKQKRNSWWGGFV